MIFVDYCYVYCVNLIFKCKKVFTLTMTIVFI